MLSEFSSPRGQRQAVIGTREQGDAELPFQFGDLSADRWVARAELARRSGEAAALSTAAKIVQRSQSIATPFMSVEGLVQYWTGKSFPCSPIMAHRDAGASATARRSKPQEGMKMPLPASLFNSLEVPEVGSPLFIVSGPELVIAQCKNGIVGSFPALNARAVESSANGWAALRMNSTSTRRRTP
jgi:hypothetical protein